MQSHGVYQYFGIYYAMGIGLVTEGFMSAFYHICPTNANFQFGECISTIQSDFVYILHVHVLHCKLLTDTAFMFIIGGIFLVKVFQNRRPEIHANAFLAFFSFAVLIFFTLIGLVRTLSYWLLTLSHLPPLSTVLWSQKPIGCSNNNVSHCSGIGIVIPNLLLSLPRAELGWGLILYNSLYNDCNGAICQIICSEKHTCWDIQGF